MNVRTRVYIAGPITHGDRSHNWEQAEAAQAVLIKGGMAPLNPMLSMRHSQAEAICREDWLAADIPWVLVSEAVLRLPGASLGADGEVEIAREHGIPVYRCVQELIKAHEDGFFARQDPDLVDQALESIVAKAEEPTPLEHQVGGNHYSGRAIQPIEYIHAQQMTFASGCVIKYVSRYREKGGIEDLDKAIHFCELIKALEYAS